MAGGRFKRWCWQRQLKRTMRRRRTERKPVGLASASVIGIYYAYRDGEDYEALVAFARRLVGQAKEVEVLVYSDEKEMPSVGENGFPVLLMGKKMLGFGYFPGRKISASVRTFMDRKYDLLIDFSPDFHFVDVSVMALCRSGMKVGKYGQWNVRVNDVCLSADEEKGYVPEFIRAMETYLPIFDGK